MLETGLKNEIVTKLLPRKPLKIILFGSRAYGRSREESDIDLLVVLDKEGVPKSYKEKTRNYLEVSRLLRDLNKQLPIDLLVLTKTQWEEFLETDSGFAREIQHKGIHLI